MSTRTFRVFYTLFSLPESEIKKLSSLERPDKITYRTYRRCKEIEAKDEDEAVGKIHAKYYEALNESVLKRYPSIYAVCEARHGEKCEELQGWLSEEVELPLE